MMSRVHMPVSKTKTTLARVISDKLSIPQKALLKLSAMLSVLMSAEPSFDRIWFQQKVATSKKPTPQRLNTLKKSTIDTNDILNGFTNQTGISPTNQNPNHASQDRLQKKGEQKYIEEGERQTEIILDNTSTTVR